MEMLLALVEEAVTGTGNLGWRARAAWDASRPPSYVQTLLYVLHAVHEGRSALHLICGTQSRPRLAREATE